MSLGGDFKLLNQQYPITEVSDTDLTSECGTESSRPPYSPCLSRKTVDDLFLSCCQQHVSVPLKRAVVNLIPSRFPRIVTRSALMNTASTSPRRPSSPLSNRTPATSNISRTSFTAQIRTATIASAASTLDFRTAILELATGLYLISIWFRKVHIADSI